MVLRAPEAPFFGIRCFGRSEAIGGDWRRLEAIGRDWPRLAAIGGHLGPQMPQREGFEGSKGASLLCLERVKAPQRVVLRAPEGPFFGV